VDAIAHLTSALAGRYEINREIGRGGMATVYVARDIKHQRNVALKVLSPELAAVLGGERFLAEIRVTANLQHPNLLPLFDSGDADGSLFYVMPFVEGESLRHRIEREKQLPIDDAVRIATAVAGALDYAHRHGVIHRDLKPENILLHEGQPLVADFGIALAVSNAGGARITQTGLSLGTPQYMSPEQATGDRVIDGRSDIYSLGAVLYEMLTGEPPHTGRTAQAVIARVLTETPRSVRATRASVPEHVAVATRRALERLPADRWTTGAQFVEALQSPAATEPLRAVGSEPVSPVAPHWIRRLARPSILWPIAFAIAAIVTATAWRRDRASDANSPTMRFTLVPSRDHRFADFIGRDMTISRDGQTIVYMGIAGSTRQFYVRRLNDLVARPLPDSRNAQDPAISPDGKSVAFTAGNRLWTMALDGGPRVPLADRSVEGGVAWGADGFVYFTAPDKTGRGMVGGSLWRVRASGGAPTQLPRLIDSTRERGQWWPILAADSKLLFYTSIGQGGFTELHLVVVSLESNRIAVLGPGLQVLGLLDDYLVYVRDDGTVWAAPFDAKRLALTGQGVPVVDSVQVQGPRAIASLSPSGTLAYERGASVSVPVLVAAGSTPKPLFDDKRRFTHPRFSPDGSRIAFAVTSVQTSDIYIYDLASRTSTRLTTQGHNDRPEWTPDGKRVVFLSDREDPQYSLWWQAADGSTPAEKLFVRPHPIREAVVARDGRTIAFREDATNHRRDIYILPLDGPRVPRPFLTSEADELMPRISPSGKWLLYQSDESGQYEIYMRPYPGGGARLQVSAGGGTEPLWSPDGGRVYYRQNLAVVSARFSETPKPAILARDTLFEGQYDRHEFHQNYDVAPGGKSLLMLKPANDESQLIVVSNWLTELRTRLRAR